MPAEGTGRGSPARQGPLSNAADRSMVARMKSMPRSSVRHILIPVLRAVVLVLFVVAWLGVFDRRDATDGRTVVLVDRSASVDSSAVATRLRQGGEPWQTIRDRMRATSVIEFASSASEPLPLEDWMTRPLSAAPGTDDGTDLARALTAAAAALGEGGGSVLLVSDGRATAGRAVDAAASLASGGIRIDAIGAPMPRDETWIEGVETPLRAALGGTVPIRVRVASTRDVATDGSVVVLRDGLEVATFDVRVPAATSQEPGRTSVTIEDRLPLDSDDDPRRRSAEYEVRWMRARQPGMPRPTSDDERNDRKSRRVSVTGPAIILQVVTRDALRDPPRLLDAESAARYTLSVTAPPIDPAALAEAAVIVIDDVPSGPAGLDVASQARIVAAVRDRGVGLLTRGARSFYGSGGYRGATLEPALAVECRPEDRSGRELVMLIDRSGSMEEGSKLALAKVAVDGVLGELDSDDRVAVLAFAESAVRVVAPGGPAEVLERLRARWSSVTPRGETNLAEALGTALDTFPLDTLGGDAPGDESVEREVFVITDGKAGGDLRSIGRRLAAERVRVAVFVTGDESETEIERMQSLLAEGVDGRITRSVDPRFLESWLREAVALGDFADRDSRAVARAAATPVARIAASADGAAIRGWARTTPREGAEVALAVEDGGDALLVLHRFGAGKTLAFTSSPRSAAPPFDRAATWTRLVDVVAPTRDVDPPIREVVWKGNRIRVHLHFATDRFADDSRDLVVRWGDLEAIPRPRSLRTADAVFRPDSPPDAPLTLIDDGRVRDAVEVSPMGDEERRRYGPDGAALAAIAVAGRGRFLAPGDVPTSPHASTDAPFDGSPWLPLALVLLVVERIVTRSSSDRVRAENTT